METPTGNEANGAGDIRTGGEVVVLGGAPVEDVWVDPRAIGTSIRVFCSRVRAFAIAWRPMTRTGRFRAS